MSDASEDRTASLMTPAKLAQLQVRPQPAASPAVWLDQLASDAGSGHVRRLMDLRRQLEAQMRASELAGIAGGFSQMEEAVAAVDLGLVQPRGWLARATGKGRESAGDFAAQHEAMMRAGEAFASQVRTLQKAQPSQAAMDRTLLELEVELRLIEKIMDQGARWLQDMRTQLKTRESANDPALRQRIEEDSARCELLVTRLKQLRAASAATQQTMQRCKEGGPRRAHVLAVVQAVLDGEWRAWRRAAIDVAEQVAGSGSADEGIEAARRTREHLQSALRQAREDVAAAQSQDEAVAGEVADLQASLQAAA
jgi:chromosome segregation ATPase